MSLSQQGKHDLTSVCLCVCFSAIHKIKSTILLTKYGSRWSRPMLLKTILNVNDLTSHSPVAC